MKYIRHENINFTKWDAAVMSSEFPLVFAQSFYLNATSPKWDALIVGDYEAVFPITCKSKFGFHYLPQPPFTSQLGAFGRVNLDIEKAFHKYILTNFKLIELELNAGNKLKSDYISPKRTYIIDFKKDFKFNQNTKRNIAKANTNGLCVEHVAGNDIFSLSKKMVNSFLEKEVHLDKPTISLLDDLLKTSERAGLLTTFQVVQQDGSVVAVAHFICNGKHALYLKGNNVDKELNSGSMHLLLSHAISFFHDKSMFFDFGGGSGSKGLAQFYEGLGGVPLEYGYLKINRLPPLIKFLKNKK